MENQSPTKCETYGAPIICPMCSSPIVEKSGVSQRTGKPYKFFGCSNYPNCRYIYRPQQNKFQKAVAGNEEIMKALRTIYIEIEALRKEFQAFTKIFGNKQEPK